MEVTDAPSQICFTPDLQDTQKYLSRHLKLERPHMLLQNKTSLLSLSLPKLRSLEQPSPTWHGDIPGSIAFSHLSGTSELGADPPEVPFYRGKLLQRVIQILKYFSTLNFPSRNLSHFSDRTGASVD